MLTVLITGVGGPLGQAIIKALRLSDLSCRVIGVDRLPLSVGLDWVDRGEVIPDAVHKEKYLSALSQLCQEENVQAILPGSEGELQILSHHRNLFEQRGTTVIVSPPSVLDIALCKVQTCRFLEQVGLHHPQFAALDNERSVDRLIEQCGYPLIAKPQRGSGSQGLFFVRQPDDIAYLRTLATPYVLQEQLLPSDQEYTVACFNTAAGRQIGAICMRRELAAGNTYRAWVVHQKDVEQEAMAVVRALNPCGPCNVQLRLTQRGPVTFEINPRFSGTTAMRAHFGYNEVEMALRSFVLRETISAPVIRTGVALRFWEERYLDEAA